MRQFASIFLDSMFVTASRVFGSSVFPGPYKLISKLTQSNSHSKQTDFTGYFLIKYHLLQIAPTFHNNCPISVPFSFRTKY